MEELRLSLVVFGVCAILGIAIHGMWTVRKNAAKQEKHNYDSDEQWDADEQDIDIDENGVEIDINDPLLNIDQVQSPGTEQYDELGIGEVRVVQSASTGDEDNIEEAQFDEVPLESEPAEPEPQEPPPKVYASVVTQPKPEYAEQQKMAQESIATASADSKPGQVPEPPLSLMKKREEEQKASQSPSPAAAESPADEASAQQPAESKSEEKAGLVEQASKIIRRKRNDAGLRKRKEPKVRDDQMAIDFDEPSFSAISEDEAPVAEKTEPVSEVAEMQQEVLVLNVKAPDDKPIQGSALLPMLLTLGFKFGDQDIFHRHVNSNGKGPVLFSLANMFKPGVFDIDNLENFTTQGISLFMILPIEGDPHQVFNMMHNAARKISDEFSGQVLDGRRCALTKQSLQQYVEKIREFERQRMIAR